MFLKKFKYSTLTKNIICMNTGVVILMYSYAMHVMCNTLFFYEIELTTIG